MNILDDKSKILGIDKDDFYGQILSFPDQIKYSLEVSKKFIIPSFFIKAQNIVICGMGASGTVGDLISDLAYLESEKPVIVVKDYNLPKFVDSNSLVVIISFSGNTEEELSCFSQAIASSAKTIIISSGGEIEKNASKHRVPFLKVDNKYLPRNSFGYLAIPCLVILKKLGIFEISDQEIIKATTALEYTLDLNKIEQDYQSNQAKKVAQKMYGKNILVVASDHLKSVGYRLKLAINENAKQIAQTQNLPELHHNQINGFDYPSPSNFIVLFIYSKFYSPKTVKRIEITKDVLAKAGIEFQLIEVEAVDKLSEVFSFMGLGDLISYYLAILNGVDPTTTDKIDYVKEKIK